MKFSTLREYFLFWCAVMTLGHHCIEMSYNDMICPLFRLLAVVIIYWQKSKSRLYNIVYNGIVKNKSCLHSLKYISTSTVDHHILNQRQYYYNYCNVANRINLSSWLNDNTIKYHVLAVVVTRYQYNIEYFLTAWTRFHQYQYCRNFLTSFGWPDTMITVSMLFIVRNIILN